MAFTNIFFLPSEVLSNHILARLPTNELRITSMVSKFFNIFFYEVLPWQDLLKERNLHSTALWTFLGNACDRGYTQFIKNCFSLTKIELPYLNALVQRSLESNKPESFKAFIESGRFLPRDMFWFESLRTAFVNCQKEFIIIFINNPWENAIKRHKLPKNEVKNSAA